MYSNDTAIISHSRNSKLSESYLEQARHSETAERQRKAGKRGGKMMGIGYRIITINRRSYRWNGINIYKWQPESDHSKSSCGTGRKWDYDDFCVATNIRPQKTKNGLWERGETE